MYYFGVVADPTWGCAETQLFIAVYPRDGFVQAASAGTFVGLRTKSKGSSESGRRGSLSGRRTGISYGKST